MNKKTITLVGLSLCTALILEAATQNYSIRARKSIHFVGGIGVGSKFGQGEDQAFWDTQLKPRFGELGVKHVRGQLLALDNGGGSTGLSGQMRADRINELYDDYGVKMTGLWKHRQTWPERFEATREVIDALWSIEIHNEANRPGERILYSDSNGEHGFKRVNGESVEVGRGWRHALRLFTQDLSNRFNNHSDSRIRALPLVGNALTRNAYGEMQTYEENNNWYSRDYVDFGNYHEYRSGRPELIRLEEPQTTIYGGGLPMVATETGYNSDPDGIAHIVDETIQKFYNMRTLLQHHRNGIRRTFVFSLYEPAEPGWGMLKYNNDRTRLVKKQQFNGIRNMITLLQGGHPTFSRKTIDYSITEESGNLTNFIGDVVLQRSDGCIFVALWDARGIWNFNTQTRINRDTRQIIFKLNTAGYSRAEVYKPATNGTRAIKTVDNPRGREFNVLADGHPVFVKLIP